MIERSYIYVHVSSGTLHIFSQLRKHLKCWPRSINVQAVAKDLVILVALSNTRGYILEINHMNAHSVAKGLVSLVNLPHKGGHIQERAHMNAQCGKGFSEYFSTRHTNEDTYTGENMYECKV